ncbi:MAG: DUF4112 domain-containing protein [Hyphomicrobiaceae bacterium]
MNTTGRSTAWDTVANRFERFDHAAEEAALARVTALAKVMDSAFALPGTNMRIGVDALLGLVPVVGDVISQVISSYIIWEARKLGLSRLAMGRMIANSLVDAVIGAIPFVGDAFDVAFRSNLRNLRILQRELEKRGTGRPVVDV